MRALLLIDKVIFSWILQMNVLLQDKRESLYMQNGLVVQHEILGVASIELSGFISISLWNQDAHSVIRDR